MPPETAGGDEWLNTMDRYGISYFIWSLSNKAESSALINSGVNKTSGWTYNELTDSGKWYVTRLGNAANLGKITPVPTAVPTKVPEPTKAPEPTKVPEPTKTPEPTTAPEPTKVPLKPVDPTNSRLVVTEENSWQDGSDTATIYRFDLENTTDQDLSGWSVELIFDGPVTVDQSWKGTFEVKGNKIIISPENDWTKEIPAHGKADFGLIVKNSTLKNYRILK